MSSGSTSFTVVIGNLGADPEIRYTQSSQPVATLSVGTTEKWKDKKTGEDREETEWHRVVMFRHLAERARDLCEKGTKVYIKGKNKTRKWKDAQNIERFTTEVVADELEILGRMKQRVSDNANQQQQSGHSAPAQHQQQSGYSAPAQHQQQSGYSAPVQQQQQGGYGAHQALSGFDDGVNQV